MSKIAGTLMILLGAATLFLGAREITDPNQLTPYARWSSVGLGLIMVLIGAAHFRAPHKAFLLSIPVLVAFVVHIYSIALFYNVQQFPLFIVGHVAAALVILILSYAGYKRKGVRATA